MSAVVLNARFKSRPVTGVERFAWEVGDRLAGRRGLTVRETGPGTPLQGLKGHAWEQFSLPGRLEPGAVLFSPCNTGPLAVRRQLVVIHDAAVWDCPGGFSTAFRHLYRHLLPRLARRCEAVATVSAFSRERLAPRLGIAEDRILVLGNAVGAAFSPGPAVGPEGAGAGAGAGAGSGTGEDRDPVLLCVGSLDPRKNLSRLLRTWLDLRARGRLPERARLHLVGGANPRNFAAIDRIEDESIRWLGRVDDAELIRQYRGAEAFLFPSLYEGFGLPPLEAMACGCPVLLSDRASLPEVGGVPFDPADPASEGAAWYFDPESEAGLGDAILRLFALDSAQRARMRANALARAARFSWDRIAAETARALEAVAGR